MKARTVRYGELVDVVDQFAAVYGSDYLIEHWLACYAVLLLT